MKTINILFVSLIICITGYSQTEGGILRGQILVRSNYAPDSLKGNPHYDDTTSYALHTVELIDTKSDVRSTTETNELGSFEFSNVPKGLYRLVVQDEMAGTRHIYVRVMYLGVNRTKVLLLDRVTGKLLAVPSIKRNEVVKYNRMVKLK